MRRPSSISRSGCASSTSARVAGLRARQRPRNLVPAADAGGTFTLRLRGNPSPRRHPVSRLARQTKPVFVRALPVLPPRRTALPPRVLPERRFSFSRRFARSFHVLSGIYECFLIQLVMLNDYSVRRTSRTRSVRIRTLLRRGFAAELPHFLGLGVRGHPLSRAARPPSSFMSV